MSKTLKNHEVKSSGKYIMSRTDDDFGKAIVHICEYKEEYYLTNDMDTPISSFDEECRWKKFED